MTPVVFVLLAVAGGLGASVRFILDGALRSATMTAAPWATSVINLSGSLLLGLLTGLTTVHLVSAEMALILGTGFLGGYTTFSTASYETVQLVRSHRYGQACLSSIGMLVGCVAVAGLGYWTGLSL